MDSGSAHGENCWTEASALKKFLILKIQSKEILMDVYDNLKVSLMHDQASKILVKSSQYIILQKR